MTYTPKEHGQKFQERRGVNNQRVKSRQYVAKTNCRKKKENKTSVLSFSFCICVLSFIDRKKCPGTNNSCRRRRRRWLTWMLFHFYVISAVWKPTALQKRENGYILAHEDPFDIIISAMNSKLFRIREFEQFCWARDALGLDTPGTSTSRRREGALNLTLGLASKPAFSPT